MRFGLFGTGAWARDVHAAGIAAEPGAELVGVWGRNPDKARALAHSCGIRQYDDVDRLIGDVDAIAVALPPDVQAGIAMRAAEHGCHLLLDKPLALDLRTADRLVAAVDAAGVSSVVFFTLRFRSSSADWLAAVTSEGGWDGLRATWFAPLLSAANDRSPDSPWRRQWGALWDLGPHVLSLALPLLGAVTGAGAARGPGDAIHVVLQHEQGAASTFSLSLTAPPAAQVMECAVFGDAGWSAMPPALDNPVEGMRSAVRQLLEAVANGRREHPCDVHFGRDVVAVLEAAAAASAATPTVRR